ncbi:MAG: threonine ammonia-lyase [Planctomycetota bacterium]|jgi:threonine dehydratase
MMLPGIEDVRAAAERIAGRVHRTPVMRSETLDREVGAKVFFKCENLQKIGAFKARGAMNALLAQKDIAAGGVIAHSSGNHGQALAYAAKQAGVPCTIVVPEDAPRVKLDAMRGYGAEVVFCKQTERAEVCAVEQAKRGAVFIHPNTDPLVIAGQGTASLELLEQVPDLDVIITPVGGGGLLAGTAITVKTLQPSIRVIGAEPEAVDDAYRSMQSGVLQPRVPNPATAADGLLTGLGEINFAILQKYGAEVMTVPEEALLSAARFHLERMKIVVEPSGATVMGLIRSYPERFAGQRVGGILSGGNTDFAWLKA